MIATETIEQQGPAPVRVQPVVRRRLCDNPTCSAHCEVVHDDMHGWRFASGFQISLTKEQLMHFRPESKLNVCGRCKGCYEHMLNRARKIARRKLKPETHPVWWKRLLRRLAA